MMRRICLLNTAPTVAFAATELGKYLRLISREPALCEIRAASAPCEDSITLGLFGDLSIDGGDAGDDAVHVEIKDGAGVIAGSNPRSVLLGVYRFLHTLGCRWVRPGAEGEFLPRVDLSSASVSLRETASLRHRVICIEGAVSLENVVDIIDWAPKVGFSGYFMQFPDGYAFFDRWYSHVGHPHAVTEPFSTGAARAFTIRIEEEIRRRSLDYHAIGHGWHARAIGIDVSHWNPVHAPPSPEVTAMLAEVDGRRGYRWDRPMITSLCFSQDEVRRRMVEEVVTHATQHPEVDYLHVWIDDGFGNKCACQECIKVKPSDLYVRMLHELDDALTAAGCGTRIVFIGYTDLLWPPDATAEPLDPGRFSFVYANRRGSFPEALDYAYADAAEMPPFVHNRNERMGTAAGFAAPLRGWQEFFDGDGMLFEYYGGGFDQVPLARTIHDDVGRLKGMRLDGIVNCQRQRVFFPTGLADYILGQTLWDVSIDLEETINDYHMAAFGADSALAKEFIKLTVEETEKAVAQVEGALEVQPDAAAHLDKLENLLAEFDGVCARNLHGEDPCRARSWHYLRWYARVVERLLPVYRVIVAGDRRATLMEWKSAKAYLYENEHHYQAVFDVWSFCKQHDRLILDGFCSSAPEDVT
jgi:hypothetical protein